MCCSLRMSLIAGANEGVYVFFWSLCISCCTFLFLSLTLAHFIIKISFSSLVGKNSFYIKLLLGWKYISWVTVCFYFICLFLALQKSWVLMWMDLYFFGLAFIKSSFCFPSGIVSAFPAIGIVAVCFVIYFNSLNHLEFISVHDGRA